MRLLMLLLFISFSYLSIAQKKNSLLKDVNTDSLFEFSDELKKGIKVPDYFIAGKDSFNTSHLIGNVSFINLWFLYCQPCITEFSILNDLYLKYKSYKNFHFYSYTYESDAVIKNTKEKYHLDFDIQHISQAMCYKINMNSGFPANFIVSPQNTVAQFKSGGATEIDFAREQITTAFYPVLDSLLKK